MSCFAILSSLKKKKVGHCHTGQRVDFIWRVVWMLSWNLLLTKQLNNSRADSLMVTSLASEPWWVSVALQTEQRGEVYRREQSHFLLFWFYLSWSKLKARLPRSKCCNISRWFGPFSVKANQRNVGRNVAVPSYSFFPPIWSENQCSWDN